MNKIEIIKKFRREFILFIDELIEQYPQHSEFVIARVAITTQIPIEELIIFFNEFFVPQENEMANKNDDFFFKTLLNCKKQKRQGVFFKRLAECEDYEQKINKHRQMWNSFDDEHKEVIWEWISYFSKLSKQFNNT